jgi:hypothetical protein
MRDLNDRRHPVHHNDLVAPQPDIGYLVTGPTGRDAVVDTYRGFSGPSNFGGGHTRKRVVVARELL